MAVTFERSKKYIKRYMIIDNTLYSQLFGTTLGVGGSPLFRLYAGSEGFPPQGVANTLYYIVSSGTVPLGRWL